MKFLRNFMDKMEPDKKKSPFMHTLWDGMDTFFFVPAHTTKTGTHIKDGMDLKRTMISVVLAMQVAFMFGVYNIGAQHYTALGLFQGQMFAGFFQKFFYGLLQMLPMLIVVHVVGLGIEFLFATKKGHGIEEGFLVSAFLIPMIMPPDVPLWMVAIATAFAVVIGKEAFGGTGMNVFNVALLARVFVFFAYPGEISGDECWVATDYNFFHKAFDFVVPTNFFVMQAGTTVVDGFSGATPLALAAKEGWSGVQAATLPNGAAQYSVRNMLWGFMPGSIGEVSKIGIIIGGIMLLVSKIASWRVMLSMLIGAALMAFVLNLLGAGFEGDMFIKVPWYYQLIMGGFLFALVFMATDPVTSSATNTGKWIYGFGIGVIGMIVRALNPAYPEGWMLAILFFNALAPLIDYFVVQKNIKRRLARVA